MIDKKPVELPTWAIARGDGWEYAGCISRDNEESRVKYLGVSFDELCERAMRSDHGEERAIDIYPEGATCWAREKIVPGFSIQF